MIVILPLLFDYMPSSDWCVPPRKFYFAKTMSVGKILPSFHYLLLVAAVPPDSQIYKLPKLEACEFTYNYRKADVADMNSVP